MGQGPHTGTSRVAVPTEPASPRCHADVRGRCFPHLAPVPPTCPCGLWELAAHTQPLRPQPIYPPFLHGTLVFPVSPPCQAPPPPPGSPGQMCAAHASCAVAAQMCRAQLRKALCPRSCAARCRRATPCTCATADTHTALSRNKRRTPCNTFQTHEQRLAHVRANPRAHMHTFAQPPAHTASRARAVKRRRRG